MYLNSWRLWLTFSLVYVGLTSPIYANDATVGGQGADLVLLNEKRIRMVSEEITLVQLRANETDWHVSAHYFFENPTSDSVAVQMGFPEKKHCAQDAAFGDTYDPRFRNLRTDVNGVRVEMRTGNIPENEWGFCLGNVYVFDVEFAPGERLEIHHSYEYTGSSDVMGVGVDYLTRTGSLWNGPIGSATFRISTLGVPVGTHWPAEYNLIERTLHRSSESDEDVRTEYVFQQKDWLPGTDFHVQLNNAYDPVVNPQCCPSRVWLQVLMREPDWAERIREEVACLGDEELRLCRNLVFARYGRAFADSALHNMFYSAVYSFSGADYGYDDVPYKHMGYQLNAAYSDELLSEQELQFVALLKEIGVERSASAGDE